MSTEKIPETAVDLEKYGGLPGDATTAEEQMGITEPANRLERWANKLDALAGMEARGIDRIPEELRERPLTTKDYLQMFIM